MKGVQEKFDSYFVEFKCLWIVLARVHLNGLVHQIDRFLEFRRHLEMVAGDLFDVQKCQ